MKAIVKRIARGEKGATLVLVLILILVGGLIIGPLLSYMGTGLITGEVYERRTDELYAADAGVEDAVWKIQNQVDEVKRLTECHQNWSYNITDVEGGVAEVNDKRVEVTITLISVKDDLPCDYRVVSTATGDGSGTQVEAYISATITYFSMLEHLITIQGDLDEHEVDQLRQDLEHVDIPCPEGCTECDKCWQAYDYDTEEYREIPQECKGCIAVYNFPDTGWPTADALSARYWEDVAGGTQYDGDTEIDLEGKNCPPGPIYINDEEDNSWSSGLGPLYIDGELDIVNSSNNETTLTLNGTLYITGDTEIGMGGKGGKPNLILDLNEQTIFVASDSCDPQKALQIGDWCTIMGPGCIIAVGDVYFAPKGDVGSNGEPVLILSVDGTTTLKPSGDFYGAVGGRVNVEAFRGESPSANYPSGGFEEINFPSPFEAYRTYGIASWEVIRLSPEDLGG